MKSRLIRINPIGSRGATTGLGWLGGGLALMLFLLHPAIAQEKRNFGADDALAVRSVRDPQISPDGKWVSFTVSSLDLKEDASNSDLYMAPLDSGPEIQLTFTKKSESRARWSPDGRHLGFISNREGDKSQVWLMDRRGGEAFQLTSLKGGVNTFEWSPDGSRIVAVSRDPDPDESESTKGEKKTTPPIVVNRLQFKRDGAGYLDERRDHLYVVTLSDKKSQQITAGPYDDSDPAWSPDGKWIAFVSNRTENPDSNSNSDIFVVPAEGGEPRRLTENPGSDRSPAWSPDGEWIACVSSLKPEMIWYAVQELRLIPVEGGQPKSLTAPLDRNVRQPHFSSSGKFIYFLLEDSGRQVVARTPTAGGEVERLETPGLDVDESRLTPDDQVVLLAASSARPSEIYLLGTDAAPRPITRQNQPLLDQVRLGAVEKILFKSADGTQIEGFLTTPPDFKAGNRYPTILWIHGGPVAQFTDGFNPIWQVFAGAGYLVVSANPRGSSGYGEAFSKAIWADWGNKDYEDVMAAVDYAIDSGSADPNRLGVGGWSYGGILTNYVITKTARFKAAISGASETNYLSCYGTDHYQLQWEAELGLPWENRELYLNLSPISYVDRIVTPTLILCGEHDWNVPLNQSEQLYQSLRRLGRDTTLIVYPGQGHGIRKPSYQKDRYQRFLAWYGRWLTGQDDLSPASN